MSGMIYGNTSTGKMVPVKVTDDGSVVVSGAAGGGSSSAVTMSDGADSVQGAIADAAVVTDAPGTLSAKLRGLVKILASVWDSAAGRLRVDGSAVTQPVSHADGSDIAGGATTQSAATWYTAAASRLQLLKLVCAALCDAGSRAYTYNASGLLATEVWTLLGVARTKTYTYDASGNLTAESDWV